MAYPLETARSLISSYKITLFSHVIEMAKWVILVTSFGILATRSATMRDSDIFILLIVVVTNLGVWVGGYTFIYYISLIPFLIRMQSSFTYILFLSILAMPLDIIPILSNYVGNQYSYLSGAVVDVQWTLGLGSVVRPVINIILLTSLSYEFLKRIPKSKDNNSERVPLFAGGYQLTEEKAKNGRC